MNYQNIYSPSRKTNRSGLRLSILGYGLFLGGVVIVILSQLGI